MEEESKEAFSCGSIEVVSPRTNFIGSTEIDSFHYAMFHGYLDDEEDRIGGVERLVLNGSRIGHLIWPGERFVVTDEFKLILEKVHGVNFSPVKPTAASLIPFAPGDFSHWDDPSYSDSGEDPIRILLASAKPLNSLPRSFSCPNYFLLRPPKLLDVLGKYPNGSRQIHHVAPRSSAIEWDLTVCPESFVSYPLMVAGSFLLFASGLLSSIESYIDWHFFERIRLTSSEF